MTDQFSGFVVDRDGAGVFRGSWTVQPMAALPADEVLLRVLYTGLNFKDALSATGRPGVTKTYPHIPGIDAVGVVEASNDPAWKPGHAAIVTGFDLGQNTWGGFAEVVRVPARWLVAQPAGLTALEAAVYGTAGLTAGLAADALVSRGTTPEMGEVVVTGASGGVGSLAVAILARAGFRVVASTGKPEAHPFLQRLGAARIVSREDVVDGSNRPLLSAKWAGAVDTVGGATLASLVRSTARGGCVAACGLVGGADLSLTVYPFLLRGVDLAGIDSAEPPQERRLRVWKLLAGDWKPAQLVEIGHEIDPCELPAWIERILAGKTQGRIVFRPPPSALLRLDFRVDEL